MPIVAFWTEDGAIFINYTNLLESNYHGLKELV